MYLSDSLVAVRSLDTRSPGQGGKHGADEGGTVFVRGTTIGIRSLDSGREVNKPRAGCACRIQALHVGAQQEESCKKPLMLSLPALLSRRFALPRGGQQLPKSGSINFHTAWKFAGEALTVADKHVQGHGSVVGATFNDKGAGPLHLGAAECFIAFFVIEGRGRNKGYCAFGDADGDRIFTEFTDTISSGDQGDNGINEIAGGTGKYAGIQGSGPWKCKNAGPNGEVQCAQRLDYRLP